MLTFRSMDLDRDGAMVLGYARDMMVVSFGDDSTLERQFGPGALGYIDWLRDKVAEDPASAVIVVDAGQPVGMVVLGAWKDDPTVGYVNHYYLVPAARGKGLGAQLDAYATTTLRERGFARARLSVAPDNAPAGRLYQKLGWRDAGPRIGADCPSNYMERDLTTAAHRESVDA